MIRYRNIITGCGTLLPATSMKSSSLPIADFFCWGTVAAVMAEWILPRSSGPHRTGSLRSGGRSAEAQRELDEQAGAEGGRPHRPPGVVDVGHHRAADVEVAERDAGRELLEEQASG